MEHSEGSGAAKPGDELREDYRIKEILTGKPIGKFIIFKFRDIFTF